jgi:hypothetical protein
LKEFLIVRRSELAGLLAAISSAAILMKLAEFRDIYAQFSPQ